MLDCASFLGSALVVRVATRARPPLRGEADGAVRSNVLADSLAGMSAVLADRRIRRVLLLGWLVPTCAVAPEALAAPYVADLGLSGGRGRLVARGDPGRNDRRANLSRSGSSHLRGGCD